MPQYAIMVSWRLYRSTGRPLQQDQVCSALMLCCFAPKEQLNHGKGGCWHKPEQLKPAPSADLFPEFYQPGTKQWEGEIFPGHVLPKMKQPSARSQWVATVQEWALLDASVDLKPLSANGW